MKLKSSAISTISSRGSPDKRKKPIDFSKAKSQKVKK